MTQESVIGRLFVELSKDYVAQVTQRLQNLDIERHFYPIYILDQANRTLTQSELAEALQVDKVAVVRMVDYLTEAGYVTRKVDAQDRRKQHVVLQPKSDEILPKIRKAIEEADNKMLSVLTKKERTDFLYISQKLRNHYKENPILDVKVNVNYKRVKS